jgi:histidinol-phosphate aminotransferase
MKVKLPVRRAILARQTYEIPAEGRLNKIRLDFNENTAGCSPMVLRALSKLSVKQLAMYPEYAKSTRVLAKYFGVGEDELLLTNGGDDALRVFFDAFVDEGSSILICEPTFPMYRYYAEIVGAQIDVARHGQEMEFPLESVLSALRKKPRVLFIANPNNPTGTLIGASEIKRILQAAPNTAVVIDEAYAEFSGFTVVPWVGKHPHLFVVRTFSKAAGLAGLRLGAVIASAKSLAVLSHATQPYPVNVAALAAAEAAVRDKTALRSYVQSIQRVRVWFERELKELGAKAYPSAANFVLVDFGPQGTDMVGALEAKGILLRLRSDGLVRITIGTENEMKRVVLEIRRFFTRTRKK